MQLYRLIYFFVSFTCFGQCFHPSSGVTDCIYSIWQYSPKLLPAVVLGELKLQFIQDTSRQQLGWILPDTVNTVCCFWRWAKTLPKTCRADKEI